MSVKVTDDTYSTRLERTGELLVDDSESQGSDESITLALL